MLLSKEFQWIWSRFFYTTTCRRRFGASRTDVESLELRLLPAHLSPGFGDPYYAQVQYWVAGVTYFAFSRQPGPEDGGGYTDVLLSNNVSLGGSVEGYEASAGTIATIDGSGQSFYVEATKAGVPNVREFHFNGVKASSSISGRAVIAPDGEEQWGDMVRMQIDVSEEGEGLASVWLNTWGGYFDRSLVGADAGSGSYVFELAIGTTINFSVSAGAYHYFVSNNFYFDAEGDGEWHLSKSDKSAGTLSFSFQSLTPEATADIAVNALEWNRDIGGVDIGYSFAKESGNLETSALDVYWASGETADDIIGNVLDTLPVGSVTNQSSLWHLAPEKIGVPPDGATHLIVVADRDNNLVETDESNNTYAWRHNLAGRALLHSTLNNLYPEYKDLGQLESQFGNNVQRFINALDVAGIQVNISSTYWPRERAYLMHWAWLIANNRLKDDDVGSISDIPVYPGVDIRWDYKNEALSRAAAREMLRVFEIGNNLKTAPSLTSRHIDRLAIDMNISWDGEKTIEDANGKLVSIRSKGSAALNKRLIQLAETYGVVHFRPAIKDKTHWSIDGK